MTTTATIKHDAEWDEFVVRFHVDGVWQKNGNYHTDDAKDAVETAIAGGAASVTSSNRAIKQALATVALKLAYR